MTKTTILGIAAIAFIAGSVATGSFAYAAKDDVKTTISLEGLFSMLMELETQIISMQTQLQQLQLLPGPQGPQGEQGPQGVQGQQGPPGQLDVGNVYVNKDVKITPVGQQDSATASCDPGDTGIGGGWFTQTGEVKVFSNGNQGGSQITFWQVSYQNIGSINAIVHGEIVCVDTANPPHAP